MEVIYTFDGENKFLSNFFPAPIVWDGLNWHNTEAAYQAAKTSDRAERIRFSEMVNPGQAKREGKRVHLIPEWEQVKVEIMRQIVFAKFEQNKDLRVELLATGSAILEEGNYWGDKIWGISPAGSGHGTNYLGRILMNVRARLTSAYKVLTPVDIQAALDHSCANTITVDSCRLEELIVRKHAIYSFTSGLSTYRAIVERSDIRIIADIT